MQQSNSSVSQPLVKPFKFEEGTKGAFQIGKSRFVVVKTFYGKPYVNIREYYQRKDSGTKMFAGKRGINLTGENWRELVKIVGNVSVAVSKAEKTNTNQK